MERIYSLSFKITSLLFLLLVTSNHLLLAQLPIDYSPNLHSDGSISGKSIDINLSVGSTPGSGDASSGAASYTIPIAVPPGTGGVVPSVSLSYNSMAGNGQLGMGWGLSGMSAISRVGKNFYHDGEVRSADFSWQDKFALDGKRLIVTNGDYGGNGATYGTENEDYSIVISWQANGDNKVTSFEIQTADGMNMLYGTTADSRITDGTGNNNIVTWLLKRVKYPNGNYITYDYTQFGLETVLSRINYTGHVIINANGDEVITQNPYNTIEFEYKNRSDKNFYYQIGVKLETKVLLDRIVIKAEGTNFKTYNFTYGRNNNLSYLKEIYETGTDGSAFNSTAFRYGDSPASFSQTTTNAIQNDEGRFQLGDYNADGYSDILFTTTELRDNKRWDVNISIKTRIPGEDDTFSSNYIATLPQNSSVIDKVKYPNGNSISSIDYTGDGFNDIFVTEYEFVQVNGRNEQSIKNMFIYENQRNTSFVKQTLNLPSAKLVSSVHGTVFGGDFNGDGVQDILVANSSSSVRLSRL